MSCVFWIDCRCSDENHQILRQTVHHEIQKNGILATRLCTHKEDVNKINQYHLGKLQGTVFVKNA